MPSRSLRFSTFWLLLSALYAAIFITAEFWGSPVSGIKGASTLGMQWCVVSATAAAILGLSALNRVVFAVIFPIVMLYSGIAAYFKVTMGVTISPSMIEVAMVNDMGTWGTVVTPALVITVVASIAAAAGGVYLRWRHVVRPRHPWVWFAVLAVFLSLPLWVVERFRAPVMNRMPVSLVTAVDGYLRNRTIIESSRHTFDSVSIECTSPADMAVVVVLGESLRSDHLSFNGYHRHTTPRLEKEANLVAFADVWSDAFFTHVSVPRIMTRADSHHPDRAYEEQSFITPFGRAGFRTAWISNQDAVTSYAYFMHEADTLVQCNAGRSLYSYTKWLDSDMLGHIATILDHPGRTLAVIHSIGSHWWYGAHYTDSIAAYRPEADSRIVSELTREQLVNSYDNTILATDAFLADIIDMLRHRCSIMIFISDHGESLGEEGRFLHAVDAPELHSPAMMVWYSDAFAERYPQKVKSLRANGMASLSTDNIFHSALHGAAIGGVGDTLMSVFAEPVKINVKRH